MSGEIMKGHTMLSRKSMFFLLVTIGTFSVIVIVYLVGQRCRAIPRQPSYVQVHLNKDTLRKSQFPKSYGKIKLPAEIFIDLVQTDTIGGPAAIIVSASSTIPVSSGVITLKVPQIGTEPDSTEVLWSGTPSGFVTETAEYIVDTLPVGKYRFIAIFEFTPNRENAEKLVLSKSLYLDVRPATILSSNISFNHIKRVELWMELEERVLMNLRSELKTTGPKTMTHKLAVIETLNPGIIARKIAELRVTDPEVARRIMELNRLKVETIEYTNPINKTEKVQLLDTEVESARAPSPTLRGQPAFEKAVPVRQRRGE